MDQHPGARMVASELSPTPQSLLHRLQTPGDRAAWAEFVELYSGLILLWVRRLGADRGEEEDITQDVFLTLAREMPGFRYDPSRRFRGYLFRVAKSRAADAARRRHAGTGATVTLPPDLPDAGDGDPLAEAEYRSHITRRAAEVMQAEFEPTTWRAFWMYAVDATPVDRVALELGVSAATVYQAKTRVLRRLRQELDGLLD